MGIILQGFTRYTGKAWDINRLNWFYGVGGHVGSYHGEEHRRYDNEEQYWLFGIDGIIGMEYNFSEIPFNISLDWKPAIDVSGGFYPWGDEVAFSLRYIF
jgi:hypothetical protein